MGWNSNGIRICFTIFDDQFNPETSAVIVNYFSIKLHRHVNKISD